MAAVPRYADRRFERALPLSVPRPSRIPRTLLAALALLVVAAVGVLQVLQTSNAATAGYELRSLEREGTRLSAEVRALEADIAQGANQGSLRDLAMARLGMVPMKDATRIAIDVPAPALPTLPERYVVRPQPTEPPPLAWWEQVLRRVPGFS
jgi:hypothetical protein